jgi:predicted patatin/cPLA2 family phospholipase
MPQKRFEEFVNGTLSFFTLKILIRTLELQKVTEIPKNHFMSYKLKKFNKLNKDIEKRMNRYDQHILRPKLKHQQDSIEKEERSIINYNNRIRQEEFK